jgi:hypothetical protein
MTHERRPQADARKQPREKTAEERRAEEDARSVGAAAMAALGTPDRPHRVDVKWLWANHFRVNVVLEDGRRPHSYFATVAGGVPAFEPPIVRAYGRGDAAIDAYLAGLG